MFHSMSKLGGSLTSGRMRLVLTIALACALLLPIATAYADSDEAAKTSNNDAVKPAGEICVDGLVIDWEENPIEDGWQVVATPYKDGNLDPNGAIKADPSDEDDEEGQFKFEEEDNLTEGDWQFQIYYDGLVGEWEPVTPDMLDVPLEYGDNCVRIRFKLRELVRVVVYKIDSDHNLLDGWKIKATPGPGNHFAIEQEEETDINGSATFGLTPGLWIFREMQPEDADFMSDPIVPNYGRQELMVENAEDRIEDGAEECDANSGTCEPYEIRFKNRISRGGCIEVIKYDIPPADATDEQFGRQFTLSGWEIGVLRADGSEVNFGYTDATGRVKFEHLPLGPYTVVEETRTGWESETPTSYEVTLSDDTCQVVEFLNKQVPETYCIEGRKIDANGHVGIANWEFEAVPLAEGGYEPDNVRTNGLGEYRFDLPDNDYRIPGAQYRICEEDKDGWLPHGPTCRTITLPKHPGTCVQVPDFVNQQVGHSESKMYEEGKGSGEMSHSGSSRESCSDTHIVKNGEYLSQIARSNGVSYYAIRKANPQISNPNVIYAGQKICIPSR